MQGIVPCVKQGKCVATTWNLDASRLFPKDGFKKMLGSFDRSFDGGEIDRRCRSVVQLFQVRAC